jgi:F-type H+-transporting ATPase subunit delta
MMNAASRRAMAEVRERLIAVLPTLGDGEASISFASELHAVAELLGRQPRLRRTLADPATDASSRAELARSLFAGKISGPVLDVLSHSAAQRWSSPWNLADSLDIAADEALLAAAGSAGTLDQVEDELFRFSRILAAQGDLASALDDASVPAERRNELLGSVLDGRALPLTVQLLRFALASARKRSLELAIDELLKASAAVRGRSVAQVISASGLTDQQTERMASALSALYGREINVRSAIDPSIRGGVVVRMGDEIIDATVAGRLAAARNALAV